MTRYVALLRGINVGGKNIIKMVDLRACFEDQGFSQVQTYIQSGNVVFAAKAGKADALAKSIQRALAKRFDYPGTVMLRSHKQLRAVVDGVPKGFGSAPEKFRYDFIFLEPGLTASAALNDVETRAGVDTAVGGKGVLYFTRLIAQASKSRLSKLTAKPVYQRMTVRNWNTTTKLLAMLDEAAG